MANAVTSFVFGILTVLVIGVAGYFIWDFINSEKNVANYSASDVDSGTYIYDKDDKVIEDAIDETIKENIQSDPAVVPVNVATISGKLCYPSHFLPEGEIVAKNTNTNQLTSVEFNGTGSTYQIQVDPGTYNLRYQAHLNADEEYTSGYYTKCGIESNADVCNASDAHDLIDITLAAGDSVNNVDLCDFYYTDEPDF